MIPRPRFRRGQVARHLSSDRVRNSQQYHRTLSLEMFERRDLLAAIAVTTGNDVKDGDVSSLSALLANPGGDNHVSLREAIEAANNTSGADNINFAISTSDGSYNASTDTFRILIQPPAPLPVITEQVTIDGYTQHGAVSNNKDPGEGLNSIIKIELNGSMVPGLPGLEFERGSGSIVRGLAIQQFFSGVVLRGPSSETLVTGNFIGTTASGTAPLGNTLGVSLLAETPGGARTTNNRIEANLISGNFIGIVVGSQTSTTEADRVVNTEIYSNYIGTDTSGLNPLGNGMGVVVNLAENTQVGAPGQGNVIAYSNSTHPAFQGAGVSVSANNPAAAPYYGRGNGVRGNSIYSNAKLGIDLLFTVSDGVTANDPTPGDTDSGPNGLQNYPVLTAGVGGSTTQVTGTLNSTPNTEFTIDFYANTAADVSGYGEGEIYLGSTIVHSDANGDVRNAAGDLGFSAALSGNDNRSYITATATDAGGNTSEFSFALHVPSSVVPVQVDIKPGDSIASHNVDSNGVFAVAILSSSTFHAQQVVVSSVRLAGAAAVSSALEDVNHDGLIDLVVHFRSQDTDLQSVYEDLVREDVTTDGDLDSSHRLVNLSLSGIFNSGTVDQVFAGYDQLDLFLSGKALRTLLDDLNAE